MGQNLTNITLYKKDGTSRPLADRHTATDITSAVQKWELNSEDIVTITLKSPYPQSFDIGDKIIIFGREYKLNRLPKITKTGAHEFQYDLEFEGIQYDLFRVTYDLTIDTTSNTLQDVLGDSLTGDLERFMTVLIANANRVFEGKWSLGECPETESDKTLTFAESDNCLSVLQTLCDEDNFDVEFEIEQVDGVYIINLYESVGQILPYTFKYGKGRGLYELTRENVSSSNIITRLKVYGSTDNISHKYHADRLCLPDKSKGESYIEKEEAVEKYGIFEGRKDFDDIYPTFTGSVTEVVADSVLQFIDSEFPFDLNELDEDGVSTKYLISGNSAKIHFNTGNLAGYEFEVSSYDHDTKKFTLIQITDERGYEFPSDKEEYGDTFKFAVGDKYKILDICYPDSITEEAERALEEAGNEYYDKYCQPQVKYGIEITKAWLEALAGSDSTISNIFQPGDYVHIIDEDIGVDRLIRIQAFERNFLDPYEYTLTISDIEEPSTVATIISDLVAVHSALAINDLTNVAKARNNWRTTQQLYNQIFDTEGYFQADKIQYVDRGGGSGGVGDVNTDPLEP